MPAVFYIAATCFGAIISPSSGCWHQNFWETYTKTCHHKPSYVVVSTVQSLAGFGQND